MSEKQERSDRSIVLAFLGIFIGGFLTGAGIGMCNAETRMTTRVSAQCAETVEHEIKTSRFYGHPECERVLKRVAKEIRK